MCPGDLGSLSWIFINILDSFCYALDIAVFILMLEWDRSLGAFMPVILVLLYSAVIKIASSAFSAHHSTFKQLVTALKQNFW